VSKPQFGTFRLTLNTPSYGLEHYSLTKKSIRAEIKVPAFMVMHIAIGLHKVTAL